MKPSNIIPPLVSGVLLALAFPTPSLWPLAYVGLAPLLLWLRGRGYRAAFVGGTGAGMVFYALTFSWFLSLTYWVGAIVVLGVALLFFAFSLCWGVLVMGENFLEKRGRPVAALIGLPALWVLMEYLHNHIFTGFGWGSLGYTQWNNLPVAQLASVGSVYIVSFYVVLVNALICFLYRNVKDRKRALASGIALAFLAIAVPLWGRIHMEKPDMASSLRVGVIQPNFSLDVKWSYEYADHMLNVQEKLTEHVAAKGAELVVWPESALYGGLSEDYSRIADMVRSNDIYLLLGSERYEPEEGREDEGRYYNSSFLISPEGRILGFYDKRHLAPFGEYVPLQPFLGFIGRVVPAISDFSPGKRNTLLEMEGKKFAVLICFENSFPHLVRDSARLGADFLVQLTNDGWFGRTSQPKQDMTLAVFRAIENGATLVRGTNTGISGFVDPWGRVSGIVIGYRDEIVFSRGISVETISTVAHDTFYKSHGDVWVLACGVISVIIVGFCVKRRSPESRFSTHESKSASNRR
ncbi:MAG: apolipoprotein N-acyltransferase [Candidatus Lindowbacteria bacterium]|nr:apolipoprotein N-acyltransferase [Candidatus Lindowbacteria bacterium]